MIRLHVIVEGQTEETFVNVVLANHFGRFDIVTNVRCVMTSRRHGVKHQGGLTSYTRAAKDIILWMKEDQNSDAYFTTMFDLYALPNDFPGYDESRQIAEAYDRVAHLEKSLAREVDHRRFIPYLQLHEFEALVLSDPTKLDSAFPGRDKAIASLVDMCEEFDSPELIDDGHESAPSKRIIQEIPEYEGRKSSVGPLTAEKIGLDVLRAKCRHFAEWLDGIEKLTLSK